MNKIKTHIRYQATRWVALILILTFYQLSRLPTLSGAERNMMATQFGFVRAPLSEPTEANFKLVRRVHPSLNHIAAWISATGAAVALNDLDADGLPNDVCHVDPRVDQVLVAPAPGTGERYRPFALAPLAPPHYDPATMAPMGCLPSDLNEDGRMDILVYYWGRTPIAYLNQGAAAERIVLTPDSFLPYEIISGNERWYTGAATLADVDGDGHNDLVIGNYFNDGARILDTQAGGIEQMQRSMSRAANAGRARLFLWQGASGGLRPEVRFRDASSALDEEVAHGWTLAVGAADLDGDLLPELYFANDFGPDRLLHNRSTPGNPQFALLKGRKTLTVPNSKTLGNDSHKGMGIDFGDLNGDGILDMFVSNIAAEYALEESNFAFVSAGETSLLKQGVAPWVDRSEELGLSRSGWGWETKLADFNNDGVLEALQATGFIKGSINRWPELHELAMGNDELLSHPFSWPRFRPGDDLSSHQNNPFYVRAGNGRYYDVAQELRLGEPQVSRGIATADVDGDGRLDFAVANQWETSFFYHNQGQGQGAFLGLHLLIPQRGPESSKTRSISGHPTAGLHARPAVGAAAVVQAPNQRRLVAQVDGGNGHSGKRSQDLHFGLGKLSQDQKLLVELKWRDPTGLIHHESLQLQPGWHTVMLGW